MLRQCVIIGSGPAGYSAAIYAARAGLAPLVLTGLEFGGAITRTQNLENYPGFSSQIDGIFLTEEMRKQAEAFGAEMKAVEVASVDLSSRPYRLVLDDGESIEAEVLIIATGTAHRRLGLANESELVGHGVSYCATCDGFFFKGRDVFIVGGGNSAAYEALYLSTICNSVTLVHRRNELRAEAILQKHLMNAGNVKFLLESTVESLIATDGALSAVVVNGTEYATPALFVSVGTVPSTGFLNNAVELDEAGYIKCAADSCATSVDGVYAAGDVMSPRFKQAIIAAGNGARAAMEASEWLAKQG